MEAAALPEDEAQKYLLAMSACFHCSKSHLYCILLNFVCFFLFLLNPSPLLFQAVRTMRVGANLHAKGWQLVADGLGMLEMATAGVNLPQLWSLLETFFGKIDKSFEDPSQAGARGHSSTYHAKRKMMEGIDTSAFTPIYPSFHEDKPGNFLYFFVFTKICLLLLPNSNSYNLSYRS